MYDPTRAVASQYACAASNCETSTRIVRYCFRHSAAQTTAQAHRHTRDTTTRTYRFDGDAPDGILSHQRKLLRQADALLIAGRAAVSAGRGHAQGVDRRAGHREQIAFARPATAQAVLQTAADHTSTTNGHQVSQVVNIPYITYRLKGAQRLGERGGHVRRWADRFSRT